MKLTNEGLLPYPGNWGIDGICHVRVYEQDRRLSVVIAGELDDNTGTSVSVGIERIAHAITQQLITDGREFELIEHHPPHWLDPKTALYSRVEFTRKSSHEAPSEPRWKAIDDIEAYLGCSVATWPQDDYTAANVAGEQGRQIHKQAQARAKGAADRLFGQLQAMIEGPASTAPFTSIC